MKEQLRFFLVIIFSFISYQSIAEDQSALGQKPLWELGAGLGFFSTPHYLGSDQRNEYLLPIPYGVYRGEYLRSDRGGLVGHIYDSQKFDLRLSLSGSLPVDSEDNKAREGMPDLDFIVEAGPTLQYTAWSTAHQDSEQELRFDLPLRIAASIGNDIRYRGLITNPSLYYRCQFPHWKLALSTGPRFSTEPYHAYIYEVKQTYATTDRSEYSAKSGYTGFRFGLSFSRRFGKLYLGNFLSYYDLHKAQNADSPLFKQKHYFAYGLALSWVFSESKTLVDHDLD